jgi:phosphotransferase system HPr-like phosphotransfer protein
MNEAREVFRAEAREGQHIRLIVAGEIDEAVLDGLEDFIAWQRRVVAEPPSLDKRS